MSYRVLETIPGILAWATIILLFLLSWLIPAHAAVFIILFDIYWLLKTVYLSFHLRATFKKMRQNLKIDWLEELANLHELPTNNTNKNICEISGQICDYSRIYHLIILPMSNEPCEVVRESFESLVKANYPKDKFIVVLGTEEAAGEPAQEIAKKIEAEFGTKFFKFLITTHPQNLPDEIPGKGSNETWAVKEAKELIIDPLIANRHEFEHKFHKYKYKNRAFLSAQKDGGISEIRDHICANSRDYDNILVSTFDIDTQVPRDYFSRLTYVFLTCENPQHSSFQPIPLFTNNIFEAPALARVISFSTTFWQMMQQSRPERLTTYSSHSMPFKALIEIGFWNTNIVSEDSQIFWQCYLYYGGDWRVEPLFYPVMMDANVAPSFWGTMLNLYKQQRRWAWGSENIPYMLNGFRGNSAKGGLKIPMRKKLYWGFNVIEGFHSWATNALIIFALGWLPIILGGHQFNFTLLSYNLPILTRWLMALAMLGIITSAILSVLLLPPKPDWFKPWHYLLYFIQWALMPLTLIIFGSFPAIEAQTRLFLGGRFRLGFWVTPKQR